VKKLSNLRRDLVIRHLVGCFHGYDAATELVSLEPLSELALCLTRAKD